MKMWPKLFFAPDGDASSNRDDFTKDLGDLGEFDTDDAKSDDLDDDTDDKDDDNIDDDDDDKDDDSSDKDEDEDKKRTDKDDKDDDKKDDDDKDDDKKDDDKEDKGDKKDDKDKPIEPKELTPKNLKEHDAKLFKVFPDLKDTIYQHREYQKVFGSVEEAEEARAKAETFDALAETTLQGDPTDLIAALKETGADKLELFSTGFLSKIRETSQDMYYKITDPILATALKAARQHAEQTGHKNLGVAVQYLSSYLFNNKDVPEFKNGVKKETDPEKLRLEEDRNNDRRRRYEEHHGSITEFSEKKLKEFVNDGLDPENVYNNFVKEALTEKIITRINVILAENKPFQSQMNALWRAAEKVGWTRESKQKIAHTYLAKARRVMPAVRSQMRNQAPDNKNRNKDDKNRKRDVSGGGSGSGSGNRDNVIPKDPKKVKWDKLTDEEILAGD